MRTSKLSRANSRCSARDDLELEIHRCTEVKKTSSCTLRCRFMQLNKLNTTRSVSESTDSSSVREFCTRNLHSSACSTGAHHTRR
jgi:hypothetical protein